MKAIFIKELRENWRWATLLAMVVGILLGGALTTTYRKMIVAEEFLVASIFGCAGAGLILGLLQGLQDQFRGRKAFVMHRPASASTIFWGKITAGLMLYLLATGLPLAAMTVWLATPGNTPAPFEWHMTLPTIWDVIHGTTFYFTGLFISTRPARWIGSRIMPLGITVLLTFIAFVLTLNFGEALLVTLVTLLIVIPCAWGSFVYAERFERQPVVIRTLQTLGVLCGLTMVLLLGMNLLNQALRIVLQSERRYVGVSYSLDSSGRVLRYDWTDRAQTIPTVVAGNPADPDPDDVRPGAPSFSPGWLSLRSQEEADFGFGARRGNPYFMFHMTQHYVQSFPAESSDEWFYIVKDRTLKGYDGPTRQLVGTIGPNGFVAYPGAAQPFATPLNGVTTGVPWDRTNAYWLIISKRAILTALHTGDDDPILSTTAMSSGNRGTLWHAVATKKNLYILRSNQQPLSFPIQFQMPEYIQVQIAAMRNGGFALFYTPQSPFESKAQYQLVHVDGNGQVVRKEEVPSLPMPHAKYHLWEELLETGGVPPVFIAIAWIATSMMNKGGPTEPVLYGICLAAIALVSGGLCWWLSRRYAFSRTAQMTWTALGVLIGPPGVMALFAMHNLPALISCRSCGHRRIVTRESCEHCNAAFPMPKLESIEVFERPNIAT